MNEYSHSTHFNHVQKLLTYDISPKNAAILYDLFIEAEWFIYASANYTAIGSDYGLSPAWPQVFFIRINHALLLIRSMVHYC